MAHMTRGSIHITALMRHLRALASPTMGGRESGKRGAARARRYITGMLSASGVEPLFPGYEQPFVFKGLDGAPTQGLNVIGLMRGRRVPDVYITVSAHYDHLGRDKHGDVYNGADDNASGVAAVLEIARSFDEMRPCCSLVFCLFDGEEAGLKGSQAFVNRAPIPLDRIALEINVDMISRADESLLWVAGVHHHPALEPHLQQIAAACNVPLLLGHDSWSPRHGDDWTHMSDHGSFHDIGTPWIHFGISNHADTHSTTDEASEIDEEFFLESAEAVHLAVRHFDEVAEELIRQRMRVAS